MKRIVLFIAIMATTLKIGAQTVSQKKYREIKADTAKVITLRIPRPEDVNIYNSNLKQPIFTNDEITTHIIMPEKIKLVDISTNKITGNLCADNIVRIKPASRMYDNEFMGTITIIGERHIAQYNVIFQNKPSKAQSVYNIKLEDMKDYTNPDVKMSESEMAKYSWAIYSTKRKFHNLHTVAYGMKAVINNIYSINNYFFIDFSLENATKINYDISEMRIKLQDKKENKATNSQSIELTPVYSLNNEKSFKKSYRNVIVLEKLTFPDEKMLVMEISENQISGRVIYLTIDYEDILNADCFSEEIMRQLQK